MKIKSKLTNNERIDKVTKITYALCKKLEGISSENEAEEVISDRFTDDEGLFICVIQDGGYIGAILYDFRDRLMVRVEDNRGFFAETPLKDCFLRKHIIEKFHPFGRTLY